METPSRKRKIEMPDTGIRKRSSKYSKKGKLRSHGNATTLIRKVSSRTPAITKDGKIALMRALLPENKYTKQTPYQERAAINEAHYSLHLFHKPSDYKDLRDDYEAAQYPTNPIAQVQGVYGMGNTVPGAGTIEISDTKMEFTATNMGAGSIYFTAYEVVSRRALPASSQVVPTVDDLLYEYFGTEILNKNIGAVDNNAIDITSSLFDNRTFCKFFHVSQVRQLVIPPGGTIQLEIRDPKTRIHDYRVDFGQQQLYPGLTRGWVFKYHGQVAGDSGNAANVVVDDVKINGVIRETYRYQIPLFQGSLKKIHGSLPDLTANAHVQFISPATGGVKADEEA